ncbi:MAG: maleylacetoacetate isomerase [Ectothiorhodospiraceae bacterium]|nr:maleylacetoacetate isomerase [Ectothiorhodospiraceae bacterium]
MKLYGYFRSSAAYRVRIALNLKGVDYEQLPVNLVQGRQHREDYRRMNPQALVPSLETDDGVVLTQSLAICEYLDERYPEPALLPSDLADRARVRALANAVACDIHPVNNLRVLQYLTGTLGVSEEHKLAWYRHWVIEGFNALEAMVAGTSTGPYCLGNRPTLADVCLVPQVFNAQRFDVDLEPYPTIRRVAEACNGLPAFAEAHPSRQPDHA